MAWFGSPTTQRSGRPPRHASSRSELERVDVLELVDEQVAEPPALDLGEGRILVQLARALGQQVVEVEHPAVALLDHVGGGQLGHHLGGHRRPPAVAAGLVGVVLGRRPDGRGPSRSRPRCPRRGWGGAGLCRAGPGHDRTEQSGRGRPAGQAGYDPGRPIAGPGPTRPRRGTCPQWAGPADRAARGDAAARRRPAG